jgi:hypothetical protein
MRCSVSKCPHCHMTDREASDGLWKLKQDKTVLDLVQNISLHHFRHHCDTRTLLCFDFVGTKTSMLAICFCYKVTPRWRAVVLMHN